MSKNDRDILDFLIREASEKRSKGVLSMSIRDYLIKRRKDIRDEILLLHTRVDEIDDLLELFEYRNSYNLDGDAKVSEVVNEPITPYKKEIWDDPNQHRTKDYWRSLAMHIFKSSEMLVSSSEIMDASSTPKIERRQAMSILSIVLSELVKDEKIQRIKIKGDRGYYYGLPTTPPVKKS